MVLALRQDAARQADDGLAAGEEDVDAERELRGVQPPVVPEPLRKSERRDDRGVADAGAAQRHRRAAFEARHLQQQGRSEEHTSELQSLMRSSYAVFCLTKK